MKFEADIILLLQSAGEGWIIFFRIFTLLGTWLGFVLALMPLFFHKKNLSYAFFATFLGGAAINFGLKHIITRPRPYVAWDAILDLGGSTGYSMPSGHAVSATIIAIFLSYLAIRYAKKKSTKICVPCIMVLYWATVLLSRMVLGQHYLTDVIAGTGVGIVIAVIGLVTYHFIMKWLQNKKNARIVGQ